MERTIKRINIPLDPELHRRMKTAAANLGIQIKDFVVAAISRAVRDARRETASDESDEAMTSEDAIWLEDGAEDLRETLADIEKDVSPGELKKYLSAFEGASTPIRWNPRTKSFDKVRKR